VAKTLIIGAGVIGSALASELAAGLVSSESSGIRVVDPDMEGTHSSSELNAGGVRATWGQPFNIELSKLSINYYARHAEAVGYKACGYLWLQSHEGWEGAKVAAEVQRNHGWEVEEWSVDELRRRVPIIDKCDDLAGATLGVRDGLINPNLLKLHFRNQAKARGVQFEDRVFVTGIKRLAGLWQVTVLKAARALSEDEKRTLFTGGPEQVATVPWTETTLEAERVVNCAGAWAPRIAAMAGISCASKPVRQQIALFDSRDADLTPYGMIINPSGVYFHPEATFGLAGYCKHDEPAGVNFEYEGDAFFDECLWPALHDRSTRLERLRHLRGWAGQYEVSPDESGIVGQAIGRDGKPVDGFFESHSFSGHGVMHAYAVGKGLARLITQGSYDEGLDLGALSGGRFTRGELLQEKLVI
jgi:sarcosine oxidase subunit beta